MPEKEIKVQRKRTLLFVTNSLTFGGSEKHLLELVGRLEGCDVQSIVLCTNSDPFTERLTNGRFSSVSVRSEKSLKSFKDWSRIFREIKPDIVVLVYWSLWMLPWIAAVAGRVAGVKKLYAIQHQLTPAPPERPILKIKSPRDLLRRAFGRRARRLLSALVPPYLCNKTICVSDAVRDSLIRQYRLPARKMLTIHNGVSAAEFTPNRSSGMAVRTKLGIGRDELVLTCIARLSAEKGLDVLLKALSQLLHRNLSCKLIIIGEGYLRADLMKQIAELSLSENVFLEGFHEDVRPYLCAADVFVLTSYLEGLPFSILEAMACGLPCVATNAGGISEAVTHNLNGLIVTPGSAEEVAQALSRLLTQPQERTRMGNASRSRVLKEFDMEASMAEIKRVILN
jgi:glycosyltransferase involved in cell wall biosynthesis